MNTKAMNKISYGLYVLTASAGGFSNGCIINTLAQVTTSPNRISITVNKTDYTHYLIKQTEKFNVSCIDETADFSLFKRFGFATGRWVNKFCNFTYSVADNKIPYIPQGTCAYLSGKVVKEVDMGTHTIFIADVTNCEVLSEENPMTYSYYHANVKPKPAKKSGDGKERWVCNICGYIYEGRIPKDFICPTCKHGAGDFTKMS